MNQIDVYYRALLDYRAQTTANRDCEKLNKAFSRVTDGSVDYIKVTRAECTVDEEWVRRIEEGLIHIEKAIKEERQFIRSNGEIVPIEKVRTVSRESVEHLAKHSNLLTRKPEEGKDIIPDQIYTVERLNDYTVYENRFLYMLLCYLRDFITLRYNKILDITGRYDGELKIDKVVTVGKQKVTYSVYMHDERRDDAYLNEHNSAKQTIDRISLILKSVLAFLSTPLMEYCAKVAMLKPPITKTNVLKMNNNFKGAVALYDFIISYDKPGYSVDYVVNEINPIRDEVSAEMSEAGILLSFLTYEHGLGIENDLRIAYDEEELARRAVEIKKRQEEIEAMLFRLQKTGQGVEEYALALEKQVKLLLRDNERIAPLEKQLYELKEIESTLRNRVKTLEIFLAETKEAMLAQEKEFLSRIAKMEEDFAKERTELARKHENEITALKEEHNAEIEKLNASYLAEIQQIKSDHIAAIQKLTEEHTAELQRILEEHKAELQSINDKHTAEVERLVEQNRADRESLLESNRADTERFEGIISQLESKLADTEAELNTVRGQYEEASAERLLSEARLKATRAANGLIADDDFTDRDRFNELEREYTAFVNFYEDQWRNVKKKIREEAMKDVTKKPPKQSKKKSKKERSEESPEELREDKNAEIIEEVTEKVENTLGDQTDNEQKGQD